MQQILNEREQTAAAREWLSKHVPATTDTHATEERCFLHGPCRDIISKGARLELGQLVCEEKT
jgi:hypothetical protein